MIKKEMDTRENMWKQELVRVSGPKHSELVWTHGRKDEGRFTENIRSAEMD